MFQEFWVLYKRELKKTFRSIGVIIIMVIQPVMWIAFFGSSLTNVPSQFLTTFFHTNNYIAFLLPGELSVSMLFIGLFSSMSMIQDKRFGYLKKVLITRAPKWSIFLAKVGGATTRGLIQVPVMLLAGLAFGVSLPLSPLGWVEWIVGLILLGVGFSSLYLIVTMRSADWQLPNVTANLINLPLMFSSTALFPLSFYPTWMRYLSDVNPITYSAELGRGVILSGDPTIYYLGYLFIFAALMLGLGFVVARKYLTAE